MGWNTTVVILNDRLHDIEKDEKFGEKLAQGICQHHMARGECIEVYPGATIVSQNHADTAAVIMVGGNMGREVYSGYNGGHVYQAEDQLEVIKRMVDMLGYRLIKKSAKKVKK